MKPRFRVIKAKIVRLQMGYLNVSPGTIEYDREQREHTKTKTWEKHGTVVVGQIKGVEPHDDRSDVVAVVALLAPPQTRGLLDQRDTRGLGG